MSNKFMSEACQDTVQRINNMLPVETLDQKAQLEAISDAIGEINKSKRIADYGLEAVINSYLSGTMTPIANALSIGVQNMTQPLLVAVGALTDAVRLTNRDGTAAGRSIRDAYAMLEAAFEGFAADVHYFRQGWLRGYPIDVPETLNAIAVGTNRSIGEVKQSIANAIAKQRAINEGLVEGTEQFDNAVQRYANTKNLSDEMINTYIHEGYDYMRKTIPAGAGGEVIRIPTKLTVAIDEYGKARFRRQKVAQLASLKARKEAMENGILNARKYRELLDQYKREASVITNDFGELQRTYGKVFGQNEDDFVPYTSIREFTLDNTFQSRLYGLPAQILKLKTEGNDASRLLIGTMIPFIKTPWNILREGATYVPGLPWITRPTYSRNNVPTKMSADELWPRQIVGAGMFGAVIAMYANGLATGAPRDGQEAQSWKDQGISPFSIKIGDQWIPYQRIEPIATAFGLAADLKRAIEDYHADPDPDKEMMGELFTDILVGLKYHIMSKSFMEGFSSLLEMATNPERYKDQFVGDLLRPIVPAIVNEAARVLDPVERQASTPLEQLQKRVPYAREFLPPEYGLIGDARQTNVMQAITGFGVVSESDRTPLMQELGRLNFNKARVGDQLKGVKLDNDQLARYRQLSAEAVTPVLERFIETDFYRALPDSRKKYLLENKTNKAKSIARKKFYLELKRTNPEMADKFWNAEVIKKGLEDTIPLR